MKKKKICLLLTMMLLAIPSTGCANAIPKMTEEEENAVVQYTASLILQYNRSSKSRLVEIEEMEEKPVEDKSPEEEKVEEEPTGGMSPVDDTPIIPLEEGGESISVEEPESNESIEEFLGLPEGISIQYQGFRITDSYPEESSGFMDLSADEGGKILVLDFAMNNNQATDQYVNIASIFPTFRVMINNSTTLNALTTIMLDDFATFVGDVKAGETTNVVVLVKIEASVAEAIESLSLITVKDDLTTNRNHLQ